MRLLFTFLPLFQWCCCDAVDNANNNKFEHLRVKRNPQNNMRPEELNRLIMIDSLIRTAADIPSLFHMASSLIDKLNGELFEVEGILIIRNMKHQLTNLKSKNLLSSPSRMFVDIQFQRLISAFNNIIRDVYTKKNAGYRSSVSSKLILSLLGSINSIDDLKVLSRLIHQNSNEESYFFSWIALMLENDIEVKKALEASPALKSKFNDDFFTEARALLDHVKKLEDPSSNILPVLYALEVGDKHLIKDITNVRDLKYFRDWIDSRSLDGDELLLYTAYLKNHFEKLGDVQSNFHEEAKNLIKYIKDKSHSSRQMKVDENLTSLEEKIKRSQTIHEIIKKVNDQHTLLNLYSDIDHALKGALSIDESLLIAHHLEKRIKEIKANGELSESELEAFTVVAQKKIATTRNKVYFAIFEGDSNNIPSNRHPLQNLQLYIADINNIEKLRLLSENIDVIFKKYADHTLLEILVTGLQNQIEIKKALASKTHDSDLDDILFDEADTLLERVKTQADVLSRNYVRAMKAIEVGDSNMIDNIKNVRTLKEFKMWIESKSQLTRQDLLTYSNSVERHIRKLNLPSSELTEFQTEASKFIDYLKNRVALAHHTYVAGTSQETTLKKGEDAKTPSLKVMDDSPSISDFTLEMLREEKKAKIQYIKRYNNEEPPFLNVDDKINRAAQIELWIQDVSDHNSWNQFIERIIITFRDVISVSELLQIIHSLEKRIEEINKNSLLNPLERNSLVEDIKGYVHHLNGKIDDYIVREEGATSSALMDKKLYIALCDISNIEKLRYFQQVLNEQIQIGLDHKVLFQIYQALEIQIEMKAALAERIADRELNVFFFNEAGKLVRSIKTKWTIAITILAQESRQISENWGEMKVADIIGIHTLNRFRERIQHESNMGNDQLSKYVEELEKHIAALERAPKNTPQIRKLIAGTKDLLRYMRSRISANQRKSEANIIAENQKSGKKRNRKKNEPVKQLDEVNPVEDANYPKSISSQITSNKQEVIVDHVKSIPGKTEFAKNTNPAGGLISDIKPKIQDEIVRSIESRTSPVKRKESPEYVESITKDDGSKILKTLINSVDNVEDINRLKYVLNRIVLHTGDYDLPMKLLFEIDAQMKRKIDQNRKDLFIDVKKLLTNFGVASSYSITPLTAKDTRIIFQKLVGRVENVDDLNCLKYVLDHILILRTDDFSVTQMAEDLENRLKKLSKAQSDELYTDGMKLQNRLNSKVETFKAIAKVFTEERDLERLRDLAIDIDETTRHQVVTDLQMRIKEISKSATDDISAKTLLEQATKLKTYYEEIPPAGKTEKRKSSVRGKSKSSLKHCLVKRRRRSLHSLKCYFGWSDIDRFNDATNKRNFGKIRVNSDEFLKILAMEESDNVMKAQQLLEIVTELKRIQNTVDLFTGKSIMLVNEVIEHKGLATLREKQRVTDIINNLPDKKQLPFRLSSKTIAISAAAAIPFVHGLYRTITTCLERSIGTNENCLIGSVALTVSVLPIAAGFMVPRFLPWAVEKATKSALAILPSKTPYAVRYALTTHIHFGMTRGAVAFLHILAVVPFGFDVYNIVEVSQMINACSRLGNECTSRDKISYIISLTFSCVSIVVGAGLMLSGIGFAAGVLVGLAMVTIESILMGINAVVYYHNKYQTQSGENVRIFFHALVYQPPPTDVEALIRRTDWVNNLRQNIVRVLDDNDHIVAYGIGIGIFHDNTVLPSVGSINMKVSDEKYSRGLSRVQPTVADNEVLLCSPRANKTAIYRDDARHILSSTYACDNSFVIANKRRWMNKSDNKYIAYDLTYIDKGNIMGSNIFNNLFLISNSTAELNVMGGSGNITNVFVIQGMFHGNIILNNQRRNVINLSAINASIVYFTWSRLQQTFVGRIQFGKNDSSFYIQSTQMTPNFHLIGRHAQTDVIDCSHYSEYAANKQSISIDARGGSSSSDMDQLISCNVSVVRPFTRIVGDDDMNNVYTAQLWLGDESSRTDNTAFASIEPKQSTFLIVFVNRPLFSSVSSVQYDARNMSLSWNLQLEDSSSLMLSIVPYRSGDAAQQSTNIDELQINSVNCIFIDSYFGSTITPVIHPSIEEEINIRIFNVFASVNSSELHDVIDHYLMMTSFIQSNDFHVVVQLKYSLTNQTFTFGSMDNERFFVDGNTTFLLGHDGSDVYVLGNESSDCVLINNEANDNSLDTLILLDDTCDVLQVEHGSLRSGCSNNSEDATLICRKADTSTFRHVILMNYFLDSYWRHLQIFWYDAMYFLLPRGWANEDNHNETINFEEGKLSLIISFDSQIYGGTLTLTSNNTYVVFNITNESTNPLVAYRFRSDVVLTRKYIVDNDFLFVVLQGFFVDEGNDNVANDWQGIQIFVVNDTVLKDSLMPKVINARDIKNLFVETLSINDTRDFLKEYVINITNENRTIIIEHNDNTSLDRNNKFGVLTLLGAEPKDTQVNWVDRNQTLALCVFHTCIHFTKWCDSIHRIYRMEFQSSWNRPPIVINDLSKIECPGNESIGMSKQLVEELKKKLVNAQRQFELSDDINDSDDSRLLLCIASIFSDMVARNSTYRLFGFKSLIEHSQFISNNCWMLFKLSDVRNVSLVDMNRILETSFELYAVGEDSTLEKSQFVKDIRDGFSRLDDNSWNTFITCLSTSCNRSVVCGADNDTLRTCFISNLIIVDDNL